MHGTRILIHSDRFTINKRQTMLQDNKNLDVKGNTNTMSSFLFGHLDFIMV